MRMLAGAIVLALAASVPAAQPGEPVVRVLPVEAVELAPGNDAIARIRVEVKPGYHVQANPVLDDALIPISLTIEPSGGVDVDAPRYPAAKRMRLRGAEDELVVLDGFFSIEVPMRISRGARPGSNLLAGKLRYQACDDERCLFPRTLAVQIPVRIQGGKHRSLGTSWFGTSEGPSDSTRMARSELSRYFSSSAWISLRFSGATWEGAAACCRRRRTTPKKMPMPSAISRNGPTHSTAVVILNGGL